VEVSLCRWSGHPPGGIQGLRVGVGQKGLHVSLPWAGLQPAVQGTDSSGCRLQPWGQRDTQDIRRSSREFQQVSRPRRCCREPQDENEGHKQVASRRWSTGCCGVKAMAFRGCEVDHSAPGEAWERRG
jgi:hypothetical protein